MLVIIVYCHRNLTKIRFSGSLKITVCSMYSMSKSKYSICKACVCSYRKESHAKFMKGEVIGRPSAKMNEMQNNVLAQCS